MLITVAHTGTAMSEVKRPQVADRAEGSPGEDVDRRDPEGVEAEVIQNSQRYMTIELGRYFHNYLIMSISWVVSLFFKTCLRPLYLPIFKTV